jgi:Arginase family
VRLCPTLRHAIRDPMTSTAPADALLDTDLFETDGAIYMGSRRDPAGCRVGLFGVPYDGTTSFRPGTRFGPAAIREVSSGLARWPSPSAPPNRWWPPCGGPRKPCWISAWRH